MPSKANAPKTPPSAGKAARGGSYAPKSGSAAKNGSTAKNDAAAKNLSASGNGSAAKSGRKPGAVNGGVKQDGGGPSPIVKEAIALLLTGAGILLFLGLFTSGGAGAAGRILKSVLAGLFGIGAYLIPFVLAGFALYGLLARPERPGGARRGAVSFSALFLFLISVTHILNRRVSPEYAGFFDYIKTLYTSGVYYNGGLLGGIFGNFLAGIFGRPGSIVILAAGILAAAIIFTGQSVVDGIRLVVSSLRPLRGEDGDEDEDGEEDDDAFGPPPGRSRAESPESGGDFAESGKKRRASVIDISDGARARDERKILLFQEEAAKGRAENPLFGSRRIERAESRPGGASGGRPPFFEIERPDGRQPEDEADREIKLSGLVEAAKTDTRRDPRYIDDETNDPEGRYAEDYADGPDEYAEDGDFDGEIPGAGGESRKIELFRRDETPPAAKAKPEAPAAKERPKEADLSGAINTCFDARFADYKLPPLSLLKKSEFSAAIGSRAEVLENSRKLEETLASFRVEAKVVEVSVGPTVTRYEMSPGQGVKVSSIANLSNDLALSLAAQGIRIEAPIPGKSAVGIEIPNKETQTVLLRDILEDEAFQKYPSKLAFAVGKDIGGNTVVADVGKMPHLLIAGATGSGKSVCINTLIASILYKARPDEIKLIMVDPKVVELSVYNGIPHLLIPVVTDPKKAAGALNWAVLEMDRRYNLFAESNVRDLKGYNALKQEDGEPEAVLAQIVIIIDELADLMMLAKGEVEEAICRLAQKARAAGLHLIVATQRPSVDVITGLIKANIPSRLAFAVSSGTDSRTVLDMTGAEKLLGKGDMLFLPVGRNKPVRVQCGFISDREVEYLVDYLKSQVPMEYDEEMIEQVTDPSGALGGEGDTDEFFEEAVDFLIQKGKASASVLQRQFRIGYNRASRLIEELEARGIVGPEDGSKPRKVLIKRSEWENRG